MVAVKTVMPGSTPGTITRWTPPPTIEPITLSSSIPPTAYGDPVKNVSGVAAKLQTGNAATAIIGFMVRAFPGAPNAVNEGLGASTPNGDYPQNLLRRGYLSVTCLGSTEPDNEGAVYVRVRDNGSTSRAIGSIEAASGSKVATAGSIAGTGNGTIAMADPSCSTSAKIGAWSVVCTEPATNGGTFEVRDPDGVLSGVATVGVAYTGAIKFTVADGATDFVAGDHFTVTVVADCEAIPGAYFTGARDSANITEIRYN